MILGCRAGLSDGRICEEGSMFSYGLAGGSPDAPRQGKKRGIYYPLQVKEIGGTNLPLISNSNQSHAYPLSRYNLLQDTLRRPASACLHLCHGKDDDGSTDSLKPLKTRCGQNGTAVHTPLLTCAGVAAGAPVKGGRQGVADRGSAGTPCSSLHQMRNCRS